ncbi:hypothetical protein C8J56DRAFT_123089 [Mycena floridula]|nr:hypothetical protein C8J56DRAFT_123089 [Mycena floridula]
MVQGIFLSVGILERLRLVWGWAFFWVHLDFILWLNSSQTTIAHVIHALQCLIEFYFSPYIVPIWIRLSHRLIQVSNALHIML